MRVRTWCRYGLLTAVLVLPVAAGAAVSDAWITTKAKIALLSTPGVSSTAVNVDTVEQVKKSIENREDLKDANISVEVHNGVARLTGTIKSEQKRIAAAIAARSTPGVRAVHDDLRMG